MCAEEEEQLWEEHRGDEAVEFIYETVKTNPGEVVIAVIGTGSLLINTASLVHLLDIANP